LPLTQSFIDALLRLGGAVLVQDLKELVPLVAFELLHELDPDFDINLWVFVPP